MNHRHRERETSHLPFDTYFGARYLGRFFSCNVGQEGLFLHTGSIHCPTDGFLDLRFHVDGVGHRLRGMVIHQVQGQGVGIQLAYWRTGDVLAHRAYTQYILPNRLNMAA